MNKVDELMKLLAGAYVSEIKDVDGAKIVVVKVPGIPGVIMLSDRKPAISAKGRTGKITFHG